MENPLKKTISEMAAAYGPDEQLAFKDGAVQALDAVSCFLAVSSHLGEKIKISDLRQYIEQLKK
jgi:hypothetical protein